MYKLALSTILLLFILINLKAQIASFKILNQTSSIKETVNNNRNGNDFITLESIQFKFLEKTKTQKETELKSLFNELNANATGKDDQPTFNDEIIKTKSDRIKRLKTELNIIHIQQDSLNFLFKKDLLKYNCINKLFLNSITSRAFFDLLYGDDGKRFRALGNSGINFGTNTASIYSELISGNLGLIRVSLGSMIASNSNDSLKERIKEEAYQRLVTYGGNAVLNLEFPLVYIHSKKNDYNLISRIIAKGTSDIPAFGTSTEKWAGSGLFGIDFYGDASLSNNQLRFYFNLNANKIYGTKIFRDNLGISNTNFTFGQLSLGLIYSENFKISFIIATFSSEKSLRNKNVIVGGQVLR